MRNQSLTKRKEGLKSKIKELFFDQLICLKTNYSSESENQRTNFFLHLSET